MLVDPITIHPGKEFLATIKQVGDAFYSRDPKEVDMTKRPSSAALRSLSNAIEQTIDYSSAVQRAKKTKFDPRAYYGCFDLMHKWLAECDEDIGNVLRDVLKTEKPRHVIGAAKFVEVLGYLASHSRVRDNAEHHHFKSTSPEDLPDEACIFFVAIMDAFLASGKYTKTEWANTSGRTSFAAKAYTGEWFRLGEVEKDRPATHLAGCVVNKLPTDSKPLSRILRGSTMVLSDWIFSTDQKTKENTLAALRPLVFCWLPLFLDIAALQSSADGFRDCLPKMAALEPSKSVSAIIKLAVDLGYSACEFKTWEVDPFQKILNDDLYVTDMENIKIVALSMAAENVFAVYITNKPEKKQEPAPEQAANE